MEDILAVVVVLALVVAFTFGLKAIIRGLAEKKAEKKRQQEESDKFWEAERERTKKIAQERTLARMASINTPPTKKREFVKREEPVATHVQSPTQSVSSYQDNFLSDVVTAVAINSLLSNTHKSAEERSVGVSKSESSWGFDDSDSRKSASESLSSSSWSSSSDSSSSSSDSGPSSDW